MRKRVLRSLGDCGVDLAGGSLVFGVLDRCRYGAERRDRSGRGSSSSSTRGGAGGIVLCGGRLVRGSVIHHGWRRRQRSSSSSSSWFETFIQRSWCLRAVDGGLLLCGLLAAPFDADVVAAAAAADTTAAAAGAAVIGTVSCS